MDTYKTATSGGFRFLAQEQLLSVTSSAALFENAPTGTCVVSLSIYTGNLYLSYDGGTAPVAASIGEWLGPGNYTLVGDINEFKRTLAIGVNVTGFVVYRGTNG